MNACRNAAIIFLGLALAVAVMMWCPTCAGAGTRGADCAGKMERKACLKRGRIVRYWSFTLRDASGEWAKAWAFRVPYIDRHIAWGNAPPRCTPLGD